MVSRSSQRKVRSEVRTEKLVSTVIVTKLVTKETAVFGAGCNKGAVTADVTEKGQLFGAS